MDNTQHKTDIKSNKNELTLNIPIRIDTASTQYKNMTHSDTDITIVATHTRTTTSEEVKKPEKAFALIRNMHCSSDSQLYKKAANPIIKRQPSSMSNIDLLVQHPIPPRIITKDASWSFIWIDDHFVDSEEVDFQRAETATATAATNNNLSNSKSSHDLITIVDEKSSKRLLPTPSVRGFCNLFTIVFIILIILFLFVYPFITVYFIPSSKK